MARVDVQRLNVPADFAAIFDKPVAPAIEPLAPAVVAAAPQTPQTSALADTCVKCQCRLSAVEAKMGRCLSCGTVMASQQVKVGI